MVNIGANQISLLTSAKFKYFGEFKEIQIALDRAMQEIVDIAKKKEIHLTTKDKEDIKFTGASKYTIDIMLLNVVDQSRIICRTDDSRVISFLFRNAIF